LLCCERKYASSGYERWVSSSSADQRSHSCNSCSSAAAPSGPPPWRCSSSAALGGDPARASSSEMVTSRRENACIDHREVADHDREEAEAEARFDHREQPRERALWSHVAQPQRE